MFILRQDHFGGIAFNPANASQLWLDQELFDCIKNKKVTASTAEVYKKLGVKKLDYKLIIPPRLVKPDFPFMVLSGPVLADICITTRCNLSCPHCYMESRADGIDMEWNNILKTLDECQRIGVLQIALGGGEPTIHPQFNRILKEIRKRQIVPNITTNGRRLTWKTIFALARYAGAVALSIEEIGHKFEKRRGFLFAEFVKSIKKIKAAGIPLVFQITISAGNLPRLNETVKYLLKYKPYGILFLAYKPQGRGKKYDAPLAQADHLIATKVLNKVFDDLHGKTRIGFDCCLTPSLMAVKPDRSFKGCSAARESLAIMPDLTVMPCSFLNNPKDYENLKNVPLEDAWYGRAFNEFRLRLQRQYLQGGCQACASRDICLGGCPEFTLAKCSNIKLNK